MFKGNGLLTILYLTSSFLVSSSVFNLGRSRRSTPLSKESGYLKDYEATMKTFFDPKGKEATSLQLLFAPNNYHLLQNINDLSASDKDLELEDLVYLGCPLFKWINRVFSIYIFCFQFYSGTIIR